MSLRTLTLIAVAALMAGSVGAQPASANDAQLALQAGVEPGAYSTSQLIRLLDAKRENETNRINYILRESDGTATRQSFSLYDVAASEPTSSFGTGVHSDQF